VLPVRTFYRNGLALLGYGGTRESASRLAQGISTVAGELVAGRVRIPVAEVLPLDRVEDALALLRGRAVVGKVVLDVRS
jgi:NADPH2:quinone reductase